MAYLTRPFNPIILPSPDNRRQKKKTFLKPNEKMKGHEMIDRRETKANLKQTKLKSPEELTSDWITGTTKGSTMESLSFFILWNNFNGRLTTKMFLDISRCSGTACWNSNILFHLRQDVNLFPCSPRAAFHAAVRRYGVNGRCILTGGKKIYGEWTCCRSISLCLLWSEHIWDI